MSKIKGKCLKPVRHVTKAGTPKYRCLTCGRWLTIDGFNRHYHD